MIKNIMIILFILISINSASAYSIYINNGECGATATQSYNFDGDGAYEYPNCGYIHTSSSACGGSGSQGRSESYFYDTKGNTVNYSMEGQLYASHEVSCVANTAAKILVETSSSAINSNVLIASNTETLYEDVSWSLSSSTNLRLQSECAHYRTSCMGNRHSTSWAVLTISNTQLYNISGTTDCLNYVKLRYNDSVIAEKKLNSTDKNYKFSCLIEGFTYTLLFSDTTEYEFICGDSDIVYNFDACSHTQYRLEERCGNLIPDSEGTYTEYDGFWATIWDFYEPSGILDISNSSATKIAVHSKTFIGDTRWVIDPVVSGTTYTLQNPTIAWGLKVIVQNESDSELINDAIVKVDQDCYCTSGYSTRQKLTVNGMSQFGDMSLQDASLMVMGTGYKILEEDTTGYNVFLSGRSNFSSKTWIVKLAPSSSNNSSSFYEVPNKVDIHFRDVTGNLTSKILDTDAHVDLYYQNNNTEEEAMTLRFESSSTHTYFMPERTYTIPHDTSGYKRITNEYFTPWDYSYRAVIYNSSIYGWNITIPLTVRNGTREEEQHYQNLTTNLWFMYASDGKVDYRDDMKVAIHARSNNTTLMTIDIELWKDEVYIACKNLTATDFAGADFPYYYVWNPVFDYVSGSNYSVRMYGFDRTLLETDYVVCVSDDTTRKNKLTIGVKDRAGGNLNNCYIYLEGWGSLSTGSTYYNAYEGVDNGDYRYKATKSGYSGGGWESVNLTDEDKIVWYVLSEDYTNTSTAAQKFTDEDIKGFFFPLMFFLLTCIALGGFKYVAQ